MANENAAPNASVEALANVTSTVYCSIKGDDLATKKLIFNAVSNSKPLKDFIGKTLRIKDVIAQNVRLEDMNNKGEFNDSVRVVLIDEKGEAYGTVSSGIMNSLTNMFAIVGEPHEWGEPLPMKVNSKKGRRGFDFLSLELA